MHYFARWYKACRLSIVALNNYRAAANICFVGYRRRGVTTLQTPRDSYIIHSDSRQQKTHTLQKPSCFFFFSFFPGSSSLFPGVLHPFIASFFLIFWALIASPVSKAYKKVSHSELDLPIFYQLLLSYSTLDIMPARACFCLTGQQHYTVAVDEYKHLSFNCTVC